MHRHFHRHKGHWGREGRHGGPRMRGRVFEQGDLRLVILKLIAEKPRHGYEVMKAIEEALGGAYSPSPGVIYPTLTYLEETGLARIEAEEDGKKRYAATEAGLDHLKKEAAAVDAAFARADGVGGDRAHMFRLRRALENLKTAIRLRTMQGPLTQEQVDAMCAAIDGAAAAIERS